MVATLAEFGLEVKPEVHEHPSEAGFCGVSWNPRSGHRYSRDPLLALSKLCWTSSAYDPSMMLALKAEALSIQCPHQPLVAGICSSLRRDGVARGVQLNRYDVERYNVMGLRVLPMAGSAYSVQLTRGKYISPSDEDYELWAARWGLAPSLLREADAQASKGDYRLLREALAQLSILLT